MLFGKSHTRQPPPLTRGRVAIELGGPDHADDVVTVLLTPEVLDVVQPA